jgi:cytochrome oxidase assembly protein ShyY1
MSRPSGSELLRLALTPRWLLFATVTVAFVVVCLLLGRWQWERTQDTLAAERAAQAQPVALESVDHTDGVAADGIGRRVFATGSYDPALHVVATGRAGAGDQEGEAGVWVVDGLRLADGRLVPVVRGWLPSPDAAGAVPPSGSVTITGTLQPDETFYPAAEPTAGSVLAIRQSALEAASGTDVAAGFVVLATQDPASDPAPSPVEPMVGLGGVPFPLQNVAYTFQWVLFAGFAIVVYLRWLWLDAQRRGADEDENGPAERGEVGAVTGT